jgi:hypothetical protein
VGERESTACPGNSSGSKHPLSSTVDPPVRKDNNKVSRQKMSRDIKILPNISANKKIFSQVELKGLIIQKNRKLANTFTYQFAIKRTMKLRVSLRVNEKSSFI